MVKDYYVEIYFCDVYSKLRRLKNTKWKIDKLNILDEIVRINKPLLILARPGMGKTYALAYKIKHLVVDEEVDPDKIAVITFTNEAKINMRKKLILKMMKMFISRMSYSHQV